MLEYIRRDRNIQQIDQFVFHYHPMENFVYLVYTHFDFDDEDVILGIFDDQKIAEKLLFESAEKDFSNKSFALKRFSKNVPDSGIELMARRGSIKLENPWK